MKILLANPRGFCAGVNRAISIVDYALIHYGAPIYIWHEIVHNRYVINKFRKLGSIFVEHMSDVPYGAILIFSAHGVSNKIRQEAKLRNLTMLLDATCPLVTKIHRKVARASSNNTEVIVVGHAGHPEIEGTIGQYNNIKGGIYLVESIEDVWSLQVKNEKNLCFVTQTTLSVDYAASIIDALKVRFPHIALQHKNDICYATTNRQEATRALSATADIIIVIGSKNSSNSNRLVEISYIAGTPSYLIDSYLDIQEHWLTNVSIVGLTAGASVPNILVQQVIERLNILGANEITEIIGNKNEDNIFFDLPKELRPVR